MRRRRPRARRAIAVGAPALLPVLAALPQTAAAHAFGARYDLPLPLDIYLTGAGLVVLLTFVVATVLLRPGNRLPVAHVDIRPAGRRFRTAAAALGRLGGALGLAVLALVVASALTGSDSPTRNFAPTFVWVIWWVGFAYLAALVTDLWPWLNPWRPVAFAAARLAGGAGRPPRLQYPAALGLWPAVVLFAVFAWIEIVSEAGEQPRLLAALILSYSVLTAAGAALFGARTWLAHGEVFAVLFAVFGRFAPLRFGDGGLRLRPFGHGLLDDREVPTALMVFVVLILSTVTFDGFIETPAWTGILDWLVADMTVRPLLLALRGAGVDLLAAIKSTALLLFPLLFLAVYLGFCRLTGRFAGSGQPAMAIGRRFVFSLVPIAIAYHLAHYFSFLLLAGQLIIPLASDPFALGWNLFGTANRAIDITVVDAKTTWFMAVAAIVAGHVIAVLLGHLTALRTFASRRAAALSQVPMTVLMICYTMISLWILSQPIVQEPAI